jgi:hypothetical protein
MPLYFSPMRLALFTQGWFSFARLSKPFHELGHAVDASNRSNQYSTPVAEKTRL